MVGQVQYRSVRGSSSAACAEAVVRRSMTVSLRAQSGVKVRQWYEVLQPCRSPADGALLLLLAPLYNAAPAEHMATSSGGRDHSVREAQWAPAGGGACLAVSPCYLLHRIPVAVLLQYLQLCLIYRVPSVSAGPAHAQQSGPRARSRADRTGGPSAPHQLCALHDGKSTHDQLGNSS